MKRMTACRAKRRRGIDMTNLLTVVIMLSVISLVGWVLAPKNAEATVAITSCGDCHGYPPKDSPTRVGWGTGMFRGSHNVHAGYSTISGQYSYPCNTCHQNPNWNTFNHRADTINIRTPLNGAWGSYSKGPSFAQVNNPVMGSCNGVYCHSNAQGPTGTGAPTYTSPLWSTVLGCDGCHQKMSTTGTGSHTQHVTNAGFDCNICHGTGYWGTGNSVINAVGTHVNQNINLTFTGLAGGTTYTKGNTFAAGSAAYGTCTGNCHGSGTNSGTWSSNTTNAQCTKCHGLASTAAQYAADTNRAAPGWSTGGATGVSTSGASAFTDPDVGAHNAHLQATQRYSDGTSCNSCHIVPVNVTDGNHMTARPAEIVWGTLARSFALTPVWNTSTNTCSNVYCHGARMPSWDTGGTSRIPVWTTNMLSGTPAVNGDCNKCHGAPPTRGDTAATHTGYTTMGSCNQCHSHVNLNGTFTTLGRSLHIDGKVDGGGDCIGCHSSTKAITVGPLAGAGSRRAVATEFQNTWSHKRQAGGAVKAADCIVCHMEGNPSDLSTNATYHKNGLIDLRNPDTGGVIERVVFVNAAGQTGPGWYSIMSGTWMTFERFSRNLNSTTLEPLVQAIQVSHCLKCHDGNGAASSLAWVSGGSASRPFNTWVSWAGAFSSWTTRRGMHANNQAGGVVNVQKQFWFSNSTYHPVLARQNNSYAWGTRMKAPWNVTTKAWGSFNRWGDLMSCWDCHAAPADSGTITQSVTAHGAPATIRGNVFSNPVTLCNICHARYDTTASQHGTRSALNSNTNNGMSTYLQTQCQYCHASALAPARPVRGEDVHGFDRLWSSVGGSLTDALWPVGATETSRPYAFIRNPIYLINHRPRAMQGLAVGTATCTERNVAPCDNGMGTYTPGGAY